MLVVDHWQLLPRKSLRRHGGGIDSRAQNRRHDGGADGIIGTLFILVKLGAVPHVIQGGVDGRLRDRQGKVPPEPQDQGTTGKVMGRHCRPEGQLAVLARRIFEKGCRRCREVKDAVIFNKKEQYYHRRRIVRLIFE
jgi:hypothetical protein